MKKIVITLLLYSNSHLLCAQGIFNQNGTWIKNQIKQIALWGVYIKDIEKGYHIAKEGLDAIGAIKNGDFHLHFDHFNSLMTVNPAVKKYSKAVEIVLLQSAIKRCFVKTSDEYVNLVFTNLYEQSTEDVEQLQKLVSTGNYSLTDDERIIAIDRLYAAMKKKYAFARSFAHGVCVLMLQQSKEKSEVYSGRLLNNIQLP